MRYMQWIPASVKMPDAELKAYRQKWGPDSYIEVISFISGAEIPTALGYDGTGFFAINDEEYDDFDREYYAVTHWMSMPPSPKECIIHIDLGDQIEANFELLEAIMT